MSDADSELTGQAGLNALLRPLVERFYPQPMFAPVVSAEQVLVTLSAIEERCQALDPLAQALLCEATRQLIIFNSPVKTSHNAALFLLSELVEPLGLQPEAAKAQVAAALQKLAGLQLALSDATLPKGEVLLQSFSVVWRSSLRYSAPDEDYLVTLVLGEEVMPLLRFAASIQDESELLPDWLRCDGRRGA